MCIYTNKIADVYIFIIIILFSFFLSLPPPIIWNHGKERKKKSHFLSILLYSLGSFHDFPLSTRICTQVPFEQLKKKKKKKKKKSIIFQLNSSING